MMRPRVSLPPRVTLPPPCAPAAPHRVTLR